MNGSQPAEKGQGGPGDEAMGVGPHIGFEVVQIFIGRETPVFPPSLEEGLSVAGQFLWTIIRRKPIFGKGLQQGA
jgi:hypothetical protein